MIDTLRLANRLAESGMGRPEAEALAAALYEAMSETSTTSDLQALTADVKAMGAQLIAVWAALTIPMWVILFGILIAI